MKKLLILSFILALLCSRCSLVPEGPVPIETRFKEITLNVDNIIPGDLKSDIPWDAINHYDWLPYYDKTLFFDYIRNEDYDTSVTFTNITTDTISLRLGEYDIIDDLTDVWYQDINYGCGFLYQLNTTNATITESTDSIILYGDPLSNCIMIYDSLNLFKAASLSGSAIYDITHWLKHSEGITWNYIYIPGYRNAESPWILTLMTHDERSTEIDLSNLYGKLFRVTITKDTLKSFSTVSILMSDFELVNEIIL